MYNGNWYIVLKRVWNYTGRTRNKIIEFTNNLSHKHMIQFSLSNSRLKNWQRIDFQVTDNPPVFSNENSIFRISKIVTFDRVFYDFCIVY